MGMTKEYRHQNIRRVKHKQENVSKHLCGYEQYAGRIK